MTVLLLGGNGLLGHNVLKLLLEQGYAMHALVRNPNGLRTETFPQAQTLLKVVKGCRRMRCHSELRRDDRHVAAALQ